LLVFVARVHITDHLSFFITNHFSGPGKALGRVCVFEQ